MEAHCYRNNRHGIFRTRAGFLGHLSYMLRYYIVGALRVTQFTEWQISRAICVWTRVIVVKLYNRFFYVNLHNIWKKKIQFSYIFIIFYSFTFWKFSGGRAKLSHCNFLIDRRFNLHMIKKKFSGQKNPPPVDPSLLWEANRSRIIVLLLAKMRPSASVRMAQYYSKVFLSYGAVCVAFLSWLVWQISGRNPAHVFLEYLL